MNPPEKKLFKDWFDIDAARRLSEQIQAVHPSFDSAAFEKKATRNLEKLEMNARVAQFSEAMAAYLPADKEVALQILTRSLPPCLPGAENVTDGWLQWPLGKFIADYGLPHFETAMQAMIALTQRFSSEFAVRPFIEQQPDKTLARLLELTTHPSPHVRRWCSEGSRPLLPWGKKLHALVADPNPVAVILEALKDETELYVQKSVANHLNDIAKHHPEWVIQRCQAWQNDAGPGRQWIIRHGLRTLIKQGHPDALALLGYGKLSHLQASLTLQPAEIEIGQSTEMNLTLQNLNKTAQDLLIDYAVTYVRKQAGTGRKVFKWTTTRIAAGENMTLTKKHPMKITSVRALYPGNHRVEILINGKVMCGSAFDLI